MNNSNIEQFLNQNILQIKVDLQKIMHKFEYIIIIYFYLPNVYFIAIHNDGGKRKYCGKSL